MLNENDKKVLEIISKQQLITKSELAQKVNSGDYSKIQTHVSRLMELGYIEQVESLGTCLVITQKGMRAINGE